MNGTKFGARMSFRSAPKSTTRWVETADSGRRRLARLAHSSFSGFVCKRWRGEKGIGSSAPARKTKNDSPLIFCQTTQRTRSRHSSATRAQKIGFCVRGNEATVCRLLQALPTMAQTRPSGRAGVRRAMGPLWGRHVAVRHLTQPAKAQRPLRVGIQLRDKRGLLY